MFNPKKGKTIKRHQKIIYWNSNNTISWFCILVFVSPRTRRPFGGINALKTEHLFINACYNLAVIPEHFTNQSFSVTISLLLQNNYQIWNLDSMCFVKITKRSDFLKHKPQNHSLKCMFYILIYTPKRATYPLRYKHLETDFKKI